MTDTDRLHSADTPRAARPARSNVRTALVLAFVAAAFYFGMIFLGPLAR